MTTDFEIQINRDPFLATDIFSGLMNLVSFFKGHLLLFLVVPHLRLGTTTKGEANTHKIGDQFNQLLLGKY